MLLAKPLAIIKMRNFFLFITIIHCCVLNAQTFNFEPVVFELIPVSLKEIISERSNQFFIEQAQKEFDDDSLVFTGGMRIIKIDSSVFQTRLYKQEGSRLKKRKYWKFENGLTQRCTKKGRVKPKWIYNGFTNTSVEYNGNDSIITETRMYVRAKDSLCDHLSKWVYKGGELKEYWNTYVEFGNKCSWSDYKTITVKKYVRKDSDTTFTEVYKGHVDSLKMVNTIKTVRILDNQGKLRLRAEYSTMNDKAPNFKEKHEYIDDKWSKVEYWYDGSLSEIIKVKNKR